MAVGLTNATASMQAPHTTRAAARMRVPDETPECVARYTDSHAQHNWRFGAMLRTAAQEQ